MFTLSAHDSATDHNGMPFTVQARNYIMVMNGYQKYWVQGGKVYEGENSPAIALNDLPDWFFDQMRLHTPESRKGVGFHLPEDRERDAQKNVAELVAQWDNLPDDLKAKLAQQILPQASRKPEKAPKISSQYDGMGEKESASTDLVEGLETVSTSLQVKTWVCDQCQQDIPLTKKGAHIARFRRHGKCS